VVALGATIALSSVSAAAPGVLCDPDAFEPDDTRLTAKAYRIGEQTGHTFHVGRDIDVFQYSLEKGKTYLFFSGDLAASTDPFAFLYNDKGARIAFNDDLDEPACTAGQHDQCNFSLRWTATYTGPHYLETLNLGSGSAEVCPTYTVASRLQALYFPVIMKGSS